MLAGALTLELRERGVPAYPLLRKALAKTCDEGIEIVCNQGQISSRRIWICFTGAAVSVELSGFADSTRQYDLNNPDSTEQIIAKVVEYYNYVLDKKDKFSLLKWPL